MTTATTTHTDITRRHDFVMLFDVADGNPNGDPDAGNMPRIEPNSGKGLVSDVCLKRKVRNFAAQFPPATSGNVKVNRVCAGANSAQMRPSCAS